jgi:hypothetical protein
MVDKVIGYGQERQYYFRGALKERKPLRDWLREICNCGLGFYTFVDGKLWIGIRNDSSVRDVGNAYTRDTILFKSLQVAPHKPQFNWLTGQFGDEEFDFQLNNVTVYDIDHARHVGTPDSPEYHMSTMTFPGISSKSQCARVVTTRLREELGGADIEEQLRARDLRWRTTILGLRTMAGDVVSMEHDWLPPNPDNSNRKYAEGRCQRWTLNPDWSIDIEATPTTNHMYDLTYGDKPDDVMAPPIILERLQSISGLTWMPNEVGPWPGDPLYPDGKARTFDVWQDYNISRDGAWEAALWVAGKMPINQYTEGNQPRIVGAQLKPGGTLTGPMTVYAAVTQPSFQTPLPPSNLVGLWIPQGLANQRVELSIALSPDAGSRGDLWAGTDRRTIGLQEIDIDLSGAVSVPGPIHPMTEGLPEAAARKIAIAAKQVWHSGVAGVLVTEVIAPNKIRAADFVGSTDSWIGRPLSALADQSDGAAPLWNFSVTAFDSATGELTVTPDCVRGTGPADSVEAGDVLIVRSLAVSRTATTVTDPMWDNSVGRNQFGVAGLRPDEEIGRIYRVLFGTGAGQFRPIVDNDATTITVSPPFYPPLGPDSVGIVEAADWVYTARTSDLDAPLPLRAEIRMRVDNLRDRVALVGGFLVDDQDRLSAELVAPMREIYVFGQPPTVREIGPARLDPATTAAWASAATDHTIRADTSANDVDLQLLPLYAYQGRTLILTNDNGPNNFNVTCAAGEFLFDGESSISIEPMETVRVTAG